MTTNHRLPELCPADQTLTDSEAVDACGISIELFDAMPIALWLEDYSELKALFDTWRAQGVSDLRAFLKQDPARIQRCTECIRIVRVNRATLSMYGADDIAQITGHLDSVLRDEMHDAFLDELNQLWTGQKNFQSRTVNYTLEGERLDLLLKGMILPGHESSWERVLVAVENITELAQTYRQLIKAEGYARGIFDHAPVSLWVEDFSAIKKLLDEVREQGITDFRTFTDVHPEFVERCMAEIKVLDVNDYTLTMFKAGSKDELQRRLSEVFREEMIKHFREQLIDLWEGRLFQQREVVNHTLDGNLLYVHMQFSVFAGFEGDWSLVLLALTDITARKKAEAYLEYLGKHDVLTQLKNRSFFVDELARIERRGPVPITVIIVDMNNLKQTNDRLGHAAGDALLRRAGEVLGKAVDGSPVAACRVGGDEFIILMPGLDEQQGLEVMENIERLSVLNNQFYTGPQLSFSVGMASTRDRSRLEETLREADEAMYEAKRAYYKSSGVRRRHTDFIDD